MASKSQAFQLLQVCLPSKARQYPIYLGHGLLSQLASLLQPALRGTRTALVVTDTTVEALWAEPVKIALESLGIEAVWHSLLPGEAGKSLANAEALYTTALTANLSRGDAVIALGGGVVGDLAGFVAATWYRGTRFVQLPTTLLAQVDSSVGGKVAVNFGPVKNAVGAFYQPHAVVADLDTLATLAKRELRAGLAEVVKYGLIEAAACCQRSLYDGPSESEGFFSYLEAHADSLDDPLDRAMPQVVHRCCEMKASVVQQDETEQSGQRALLNMGHTFAHAYEAATGYSQLLHGEAVAMGMAKACQLAVALGNLPQREADRYHHLVTRLGLPLTPPSGLDAEHLLSLMRQDKKADGKTITLVLPEGRLGMARVRNDVPDEAILAVLR